jgi:hypothetical protein
MSRAVLRVDGNTRGQTGRTPFLANFIERGIHAPADFTSVREKSCL